MLRLRSGLLLAAFLLLGCDHHKPANQAQAEAGNAAVAQSDSDLTGVPPASAAAPSAYPRATLVSLPPDASSLAAAAVPDGSGTAASSTASDTGSSPPPAQAPSSPPPMESTASSAAAAVPAPDSGMSRLALDATSPVVATNPPPAASDAAPAREEEQVVVLDTSLGRIVIELDPAAAPQTCENFRKLVSEGFYNHTTFHRVIPRFIIQGGDPNSKSDDRATFGQGGPGYTVPAEIGLKHDRGAVAMARLPDSVNPQRESNGSQFYICVVPCPSLDDQYTVFGHVIKGMDIADKIASQPRDARDNPLTRIEMEATLEPKDQALADQSPQ